MATPKLALIAIGSTLLQLGLAILGFGGFGAFFSNPVLVTLAILSLMLLVIALFSGGNLSSGIREDRSNRWVLIAFAILALLIAYLPAYCDRNGFMVIDGESIRWLGIVLFTLGCVLRLWPVFVLGRRFSGLVAIQPGHRLVTSGIYKIIRNPSYLGLLIAACGWALCFRSGIGLLLAALHLPPLIARMNAEERLLAQEFGAEYEAYRARSWRLIPWLY